MVDTEMPCAVCRWRLVSYSTFWLPHSRGRCTRVASPSTRTGSPVTAISANRPRRSARLVTNVPSGWQQPSVTSSPSSRSRLSPTSLLQIPTIRPARRYDNPSSRTAPTASRRTSSGIGGVPPRPLGRGARWASRAASQARTAAGNDERGQYDNGDRTSWKASRTLQWSGLRISPAGVQGSITDTLND
jgi:hypothetical protein